MSTQSGPGFNYARYLGIESVAAAKLFCAAYVVLFFLYVYHSIRRPTFVFVFLSLFCAIRFAAFTIRAILAGLESSAGENLNLCIVDLVLFRVGFFGFLHSAYTLMLDRWLLAVQVSKEDSQPEPAIANGILRLTKDRKAFRLVLLIAVVLEIIGSMKAESSDLQRGQTFKQVSTVISLVLTVLFAFQTVRLAFVEGRRRRHNAECRNPAAGRSMATPIPVPVPGSEYDSHTLCIIAVFLLVHQIFATGTMAHVKEDEYYWYRFYAMPELFAASLYSTPGLVPSRSTVIMNSQRHSKWRQLDGYPYRMDSS